MKSMFTQPKAGVETAARQVHQAVVAAAVAFVLSADGGWVVGSPLDVAGGLVS